MIVTKNEKTWVFNTAEKTFIVGKAKTMEELLYCVSNWKDTASEYKTKGVGAADIFKMPGISKTKTYLAPIPFLRIDLDKYNLSCISLLMKLIVNFQPNVTHFEV